MEDGRLTGSFFIKCEVIRKKSKQMETPEKVLIRTGPPNTVSQLPLLDTVRRHDYLHTVRTHMHIHAHVHTHAVHV